VDIRALDHDVADIAAVNLAQELGEGDVLRGRALTRILEEREQRQQQQNNDDPEGEIAQIGVHRSSFVVARIAASSLGKLEKIPKESSRLDAYNLGAAQLAAKGTGWDYLAHLKAIPAEIMASGPGFFLPG